MTKEEINNLLNQLLLNNSITYFLNYHEIKTEEGMVLDWKDHRFMLQVYEDMYTMERDIVGLKAAQITFTTTATNAVLCIAKNKKIDIIYTLPTFDDIRVFAGGKVNRIIAQNPIYQEWVKNKDTMDQKIVGENIIHFRGTHTQKAATMVSSDLNVYDEVDSSNQAVIEQYSTRLQHSKYQRQWWFSHPSVPGNGVDKFWEMSDQKHWFIKCGTCRKWHFMKWPESVNEEKEIFQCIHCKAEITDNMRRQGKWIRKYIDREKSGYWIPLLICPWVSAKQILKYYREKSADYFYNKVLGLPFLGTGNKLTRELLRQNLTREMITPDVKERVIMGIDTGLKLDYVMGSKKGLFYQGDAEDYDELDRHMERWPKMIALIDSGGDLIGSRKFKERWPGRVFLTQLGGDKQSEEPRWNDDERTVLVDRNKMIQTVVDEFREKLIPLQGDENDWHEYFLDWNNLFRTSIYDSVTGQFKGHKWIRVGRDHRALATVMWRVGISRFGGKGSIVRAPSEHEAIPKSYFITPDQRTETTPFPKVKKYWEKEEETDWRKDG